MSSLDDLFAQIPIDQVAAKLGVDRATAEQAVRGALPALVGGMQANAADPAGAASLTGALERHTGYAPDNDVDLDKVDTGDGQKIVGNVFGAHTDQVAHALGGSTAGGNSALISKLLPMLAPLVMAWLAKRFLGGGGQTGGTARGQAAGGGGIGDLLGGLLGGGSSGGLGGIGDMLGGLLGGGRR